MTVSRLMRDAYFNGTNLPLNHLDGNYKNMAYWNLKPMTRAEIIKQKRKHGWYSKSVVEIYPDGTEKIYPSASECARKIFVSYATVTRWCNKKHKNTINDNIYRWEDNL